jgi:hypothetical protein
VRTVSQATGNAIAIEATVTAVARATVLSRTSRVREEVATSSACLKSSEKATTR